MKNMSTRPAGLEETVSILDGLSWSIQPQPGSITGDYYREECNYGQCFPGAAGYKGVLEVVEDAGKLLLVQFDEFNSPEYYIRMYQGLSKKYSDYCFFQAQKKRTELTGVVLTNGIRAVEEAMLQENRLGGDFDLVTGASNSVKHGLLPLAQRIEDAMRAGTSMRYYGCSMPVQDGVTGRLQVVTDNGVICRCKYDELFADHAEEIGNPAHKPFYRQSKYFAPMFISSCAVGFNTVFDLVERQVINSQRLSDLGELPFQNGDRVCEEYAGYLRLAEAVERLMAGDLEK